METTKDKTETNTLEQLYKASIDVRINYLQTLNSRMPISKVSFMEVAPILEKIRNDLYQKKISNEGPIYIPTISTHVSINLKLLLVDYGLDDLSEYIDYNLKEKEVRNLTTVVFLNKVLKSMPDIKETSALSTAISSIINSLKKETPEGTMTSLNIHPSIIEQYLYSLRTKYDESDSFIKYLYDAISGLRGIITIINMLENNCIETEPIDRIWKQFEEDLTVYDASYLVRVIDKIRDSINHLNKQSDKNNHKILK